ncbi:MAG: DUF3520 domain-containing protein [Pedobacter sp.]|nr:MAG: DUF3520 domain-containing protein [Pedobacter sp.]
MKKLILPILLLFLFSSAYSNNGRTIKGIVIDETNQPIPGAIVQAIDTKHQVVTDKNGNFEIKVKTDERELKFSYLGYITKLVNVKNKDHVRVILASSATSLESVVVTSAKTLERNKERRLSTQKQMFGLVHSSGIAYSPNLSESYAAFNENAFHNVIKDPLSTFSIDVDRASYSNIRRFVNNGSMPPKDAVRIEEMINYFDYKYPQPNGNDPVNIITEIAAAPWNEQHKLVKIGLQAKIIAADALPASNLVFLIDVSGSMNTQNKLPLLVASFKMLTDQLREQDKVAIVVYAGSSGLVLPPTSGSKKITIKNALDQLQAGGSTAGGAGLKLAYRTAREQFIENGNNRVILATDGDFNVGESSDDAMQKLIEAERKSGVFLTVLGYGMGNYKDSKMEILANKGNGNYAYIDNISEARKVLVKEFGGTLFTVAKDVKLQVEFNPSRVAAYRLIGYENRMLQNEDFNNDQKDAGEIGSGHTVTALYEVIPVGVKSSFLNTVDDLKYQKNPATANSNKELSSEIMTVKLRYKQPDGNVSKLLQKAIIDTSMPFSSASENFRFASAVATFGMLLRDSDFKQGANYDMVINTAATALGKDNEGYRNELLNMARSVKLMAVDLLTIKDKKIMDEKNR